MGKGSNPSNDASAGLGPGGGEMGERIRAFDWSQTPLGPLKTWEQSLKTSVSIMLNSRYPMFVWWGPKHINLYNDGYIPILGARHPDALGRPAEDSWEDIWHVVGPLADLVMKEGQSTWNEELLLLMERKGFTEETYFTFSYSPIADNGGRIGGLFCAVTEETAKVIGRRRLKLLRDLGGRTLEEARSLEHAVHAAAEALLSDPFDIPFALVYLLDGRTAKLAERVRVDADSPAAPLQVGLGEEGDIWKFAAAARTGRHLVKLSRKKFGPLTAGAWEDAAAKQAVVLPLSTSGKNESPAGFLVCGVSPRLSFDDDYAGFIDLIAGQISTAISNAVSFQKEKARAEALAELDRAKTEFFSNVSHEFRTPLTLALGNIEEVAHSSELPERHREHLASAHRNSLRLLKLVNTLLDFSRIEAGRAQKNFEPLDVATLTADIAGSFRSAIESAGLKLKVKTPKSSMVQADREMWEKIVLNLISNAYKFTFDGAISVMIKENGGSVVLEVKDTGVGIPDDQLEKVFERFHRVRTTMGRTYEGTGIGLSLVRELVRLHGGEIWVESKLGKGTIFTVEIPKIPKGEPLNEKNGHQNGSETFPHDRPDNDPLIAAFLSEISGTSLETPVESPAGEKGRVLLVDDNADMRAYVGRLLTDAGYSVELVGDGVEALEFVTASVPDLILSDIMMPRMNGFEFLSAVRGDERLRDVPFIMLSARAGEESKIEGLDAGADDYLIKPFSANELLSRVGSHISMRRRRDETEQQLRESGERYRAFIANSSEGIWRFELDEPIPTDLPIEHQIDLAFKRGYLAECNDAYARQYGFDKATGLIGARLSDMLVADDPRNREFLGAFIESGYRLSDAESHERDRNGQDRYFLNNVVGVIENGLLIRAWGTQRDITDTKASEKATALLAGIVASSDDAIVSKDLNGHITSWNAGAEKTFGYTAEEAIGKHISILAKGGDRRESQEIIERTKRGERIEHYETVQIHKNGRLIPVSLSTSPIYDAMGKIIGVAKIARDISEQKKARGILDRYRLLSERARDIILFIEPGTGRIAEANLAAAKAYGYDHDELLKLRIRDLRASETLDSLDAQYKEADQYGTQFETLHKRRDGTTFPVEVNSVGSQIGSERMIISIIRDITKRRAAEQAFLQNQAILALAMESSRMGAWTRDLATGYIWWSAELEAIFGLPQGSFSETESAFYELVHEDDREQLFSDIERAVAEHRSYSVEFRFYHADGSLRWLEGRGEAVYSESGEPVRIYGVGIDITERRKLQESVLENEQRFRGLMEQAPFSIQLFDTTGLTIGVNRSWQALWGVSAAQIADYNVLNDPQLESKGIASYLRRAFAGEAVEIPAIEYDPDETLPGRTQNRDPKRWVSAVAYPLRGPGGEIREVALIHQDITGRVAAESNLRESYEFNQDVIDSLTAHIAVLDREGTITAVNDAWRRFSAENGADWPVQGTGVAANYLEVCRTAKGEHSEDADAIYRGIKGILGGEREFFSLEYPCHSPTAKRWFLLTVSPLTRGGAVISHLNVTDRKLAEESVRQTAGQLALITNIAPVYIGHYDLDERCKFANRAFAEAYGLRPEDCIGKHVSAIIGPEAYRLVREKIRRVLRGHPVEFESEIPYLLLGRRFVHGSYVPEFDANGDVVGYVAAVTDITERRRAEQEVRKANERFRLAEQASRGFIYDWDLETSTVTRSEGFAKVLGYEPDDVPASADAWIALIHPKDLETNMVPSLVGEEEHAAAEYRVRHKDGSWIWVRDEAAVIRDADGDPVRKIGSTIDITPRKLAENRLVVLTRVSDMIRTISDPPELTFEVSRVVGEHLEVRRCLFNEIDLENDLETVYRDYCRGVESVAGIHKISDYSPVTSREMMAGRTVVNADSRFDTRTFEFYDEVYGPSGERAYVAVPLLREGRWVASLWVSDDSPREWTSQDVALLETIAERTWTAVEKLRLDIARRESEERFSKAFNSSPLALTISSLSTGKLVAVNDTFVNISGYSREEAIGMTTVELGLWARVTDREYEMEQVRQTGQVRNVEYEFVVRDGSVVIGLLSAEKIEIGGESYALTVIQDITREKRAQEALLRAERKAAEEYLELLERIIPLAEALGTAPDVKAIYRSLRDFINASMECSAFFVSFYDAAKSMRLPAYVWGEGEEIDISELPPMPIKPGGGPNSQAIIERRAVITNGYWEQQKNRPHIVVRDNGIDPHSSLVVPMMLQNEVLGTLEVQAHENEMFSNEHAVALEMAANLAAVSIQNLRLIETEANARAEAETANRMKDEFLSVLSHELRTPLNAMLGWIRILRGGGLDELRSAKALEVIERNTRQQSSLIEDLLDVSRIISGKMRVEKELIDLVPVLNAVTETIRPLAAAKDVIFFVEGDEEPLYMRGDAVRLQQVVTNLLQNAVKFTPAGGVVTLSHRRSDLTGEITVRDTGIGISREFLPHIFDRFSQADSSTRRSNTGLGLGLTIVSNIVELHGGRIWAESDGPGTGATFTAQLPLAPELYRDYERPAEPDSRTDHSLTGVKILIVDDDIESTIPLKILLEREEATAVSVATAGEALALLEEQEFDLLISDIGMPGVDGYELISQVRSKSDNRNSRIRAIAFTAYASEDDRGSLMKAGYDAHVTKPLDFDELFAVAAKLAVKRRPS